MSHTVSPSSAADEHKSSSKRNSLPAQAHQPQRQHSGDSHLVLHHLTGLHQRRTPSPLPPHLQTASKSSMPPPPLPPSAAAAGADRAQSVPPGHLFFNDVRVNSPVSVAAAVAAARASPIDTSSAGLAKRRSTLHMEDATTSKRPMSPHITSATPTSASVRLQHLQHQHDRQMSLPLSAGPLAPGQAAASQGSATGLMSPVSAISVSSAAVTGGSGIGTATSPSPIFAGTSALSKRDSIHSPLSAGFSASTIPWLNEHDNSARLVGDYAEDDDEAGKGHGGHHVLPPSRPDSKPLFPLVISPQATSPANQNLHTHQQQFSGPGFYQHEFQSHPYQSPSHAAGGSLAAPASGLGPLALDSPLASTSPIIVPQARRGAINLKKATSKTSLGPNGKRRRRRRRRGERDETDGDVDAGHRRYGDRNSQILTPAAIAERHHRRISSADTTSQSSQSGRYGPYYASHRSRHPRRTTHTNETSSYPLSHRPALASMRSIATILLVNTIQALLHPLNTAARIGRAVQRTCREIDDAFRDPRTRKRTWKPEWLDAYVPFLIWLAVSLSSTGTVIIFHTKVFTALDELSQTLQRLGLGGQFVMGGLIFLTTFPPMPLYSTLIVLCGFSFGMIEGFIISYIAALSGAITVFLLSRTLLRGWMSGLLDKSGGLKKVVRAIEKQPKLLFLIRLAPYPYNLMNTLLASSPTLTFKTYTTCTALALPKLLVHTGLGTSIKNFAAYHGADGKGSGSGGPEQSEEDKAASATAERVKRIAGLVGVLLCIGIFFYLMHVARRAVDNLDDEDEGVVQTTTGAGSRSRGESEKRSSRKRHGGRARASASSGATLADASGSSERQRLYAGEGSGYDERDYDDDDAEYDEDGSGGSYSYSDEEDGESDSDLYSHDEDEDGSFDEDDDDPDHLPALDGGRAGDDSLSGVTSTSQRPYYGRSSSSKGLSNGGAQIDMRESTSSPGPLSAGVSRASGTWSRPSSRGPSGGLVGRFKAGLGLGPGGAASSTRYAPLPASEAGDSSSRPKSAGLISSAGPGADSVPMSVVSSISMPSSSLPVSLANGTVLGGRRAVVNANGAGVNPAAAIGGSTTSANTNRTGSAGTPRVSGLGERIAYAASNTGASGAGGATSPNGGRSRAMPPPRLPHLASGARVGGAAYAGPSGTLSPIAGTPNVGPQPALKHPSADSYLSPLNATTSHSTTPQGPVPTNLTVLGDASPMEISMEDRIAEMEKTAEEYFSSGRTWTGGAVVTSSPTHDGAALAAAAAAAAVAGDNGPDEQEDQPRRLAGQQRRSGPRSASEMGAEELGYGH
ncbi:hypothetical protein OC861_002861 [Tilletia horrida]|nr:hypothetical protein OC845_001734 [Tilletia horrida]KAK0567175.1 hypothetical protein OC861_002861 [Tilletia horrida]